MTFLAIWLFLWDDELDEPTGEHANNFETAQEYRKETEQFLRECLRLDETGREQHVGSYQLLRSFRRFGFQLKATLGSYLGLSSQRGFDSSHPYGMFQGLGFIGKMLKNALSWTLGQSTSKSPPTASSPMIESFRVIGEALTSAYTIGMRLCKCRHL